MGKYFSNPLSQRDLKFVTRAKNYHNEFEIIHRDLLFFQRVHHWSAPCTYTDSFGKMWMAAICDKENEVGYCRGGKKITFGHKFFVFAPAFSIVEWFFNKSIVKWEGYLSFANGPTELPADPVCFAIDETPSFATSEEIFDYIQRHPGRVSVGKEELISAVASRAKQLIEKTYTQDISLEGLATILGFSHSVVSRQFKAAFGLTPVQYRNKMRLRDATGLVMLSAYSIKEIGAMVGHRDLSQFNKAFKKEFDMVPSVYAHSFRDEFTAIRSRTIVD